MPRLTQAEQTVHDALQLERQQRELVDFKTPINLAIIYAVADRLGLPRGSFAQDVRAMYRQLPLK